MEGIVEIFDSGKTVIARTPVLCSDAGKKGNHQCLAQSTGLITIYLLTNKYCLPNFFEDWLVPDQGSTEIF